jgi:hypothetical protein
MSQSVVIVTEAPVSLTAQADAEEFAHLRDSCGPI